MQLFSLTATNAKASTVTPVPPSSRGREGETDASFAGTFDSLSEQDEKQATLDPAHRPDPRSDDAEASDDKDRADDKLTATDADPEAKLNDEKLSEPALGLSRSAQESAPTVKSVAKSASDAMAQKSDISRQSDFAKKSNLETPPAGKTLPSPEATPAPQMKSAFAASPDARAIEARLLHAQHRSGAPTSISAASVTAGTNASASNAAVSLEADPTARFGTALPQAHATVATRHPRSPLQNAASSGAEGTPLKPATLQAASAQIAVVDRSIPTFEAGKFSRNDTKTAGVPEAQNVTQASLIKNRPQASAEPQPMKAEPVHNRQPTLVNPTQMAATSSDVSPQKLAGLQTMGAPIPTKVTVETAKSKANRAEESTLRLAASPPGTAQTNATPLAKPAVIAPLSASASHSAQKDIPAALDVFSDVRSFATDPMGWGSDAKTSGTSTLPQISATLLNRPDLPSIIARQIAEALGKSADRPIELTLNPAELGRVRMSLSSTDGVMTVLINAERSETLELMRRNIADLNAEFSEMGYDGVDFAFSGGEGAASNEGSDPRQDDSDNAPSADRQPLTLELAHESRPLPNLPATSSGTDLRV